MIHRRRFFILLFTCCLFSCSQLLAQALPFADILKLYSLDSTAARQFCIDKQFALTKAGNSGSNMRYQFATADSATRVEITYPNDSASLNVQLNYWFAGAKEYNHFKQALRKSGFMRQSAKAITGTLPSYAERYINKNLQVELIKPEGKQSYWLFLHPVGEYTW